MRHFLVTLTIFLFWSLLGIWFFALINPNEATAATSNNPPKIDKDIIEVLPIIEDKKSKDGAVFGFQILDAEGESIYTDSEGFVIQKNASEVDDKNLNKAYRSFVKDQLEADPYLRLSIIGTYSAEENIVQPNYGMQRAARVKSLLNRAGIPAGRMSIKASISPLKFVDDSYDKGVQLQLFRAEEAWIKTATNKLTWYPELQYDEVKENQELILLYHDLQRLIEANPEAKVVVVGHTDQVGSIRDNYKTGLKWARQVRSLLIKKTSLRSRNVSVQSKGELEPVNDDGTLAAGEDNKRIEIIIN